MKKLTTKLSFLLISGFMLLFLGCNGSSSGGGDDSSSSVPDDPVSTKETAEFDLTLTSFAKNAPTSNSISAMELTRQVQGTILAINRATKEEESFFWALNIDIEAIEIHADVTLPLEKGAYDFYFLMTVDGKQYAAITRSWLILDGNNAIPFMIHPVIGQTIPDIGILGELAEFEFIFDNDIISTFADPSFGISIDGGTEHIFSINTKTGLSKTFIYLPAGTYNFRLNFYDGALLKSVLEGSQTTITIPEDGGSIQLDIVPLVTENTYTYDEETSSGIFHLVVPDNVIESNVMATFSLTGSNNQPIELTVPFISNGSRYEGTVSVPDFTPGLITWSLQMADTSNSNEIYAYCGQSILITSTTQTLSCNFTMMIRGLPHTNPMNTLVIAVKTNDYPIAGSIVTANGQFLGLTSNGENGSTLGQLQVFLPGESYLIKAASSDGRRIVETVMTLGQGGIYNLDLQLPRPTDNNGPVAKNITVQTDEGMAIAISLSGTDPDPWDTITWQLDSGPANGTVSFGNSTATYTPNAGFSGTDSFTYIVSDGYQDSAPATVFISVANVTSDNNAPTAENISVSTEQNLQVTFTLLGSDIDTGDTLEYTVGDLQATEGAVTVIGESATFTPAVDFHGIVVFTYTASDGSLTSDAATITLTVNEVYNPPGNTPPTALDVSGSTDKNTLAELTLLGSDTDSGDILSYSIKDQPTNGSIIKLEGDSVIYAPELNFTGSDSFTYLVSDGKSSSSPATVTVLVKEVHVPPVGNLVLEASLEPLTRKRVNGEIKLKHPIAVKIPRHDELEILEGNPDRFILLLSFGRTTCIYKGGKHSGFFNLKHFGYYRKFWKFKSPVCGFGKRSAGDVVIARRKITARVLTADKREEITTIRIKVKHLNKKSKSCFFDRSCRRKKYGWKNIWWFFKH